MGGAVFVTGAGEISVLVADLAFTGIATFAGIMLWSMTREPAWMLVIIGVVLRFGDVVFQTLDRFGIITVADVRLLDVPVFWAVLRVVPLLFIILGFVSMIRSSRL